MGEEKPQIKDSDEELDIARELVARSFERS
jgi:hypothetical protein